MREVLGERAAFVERGDLRSLIESAERSRRPAPAPPRWTWREAAMSTLEVYRQAIRGAEGEEIQPAGWGIAEPRAGIELE